MNTHLKIDLYIVVIAAVVGTIMAAVSIVLGIQPLQGFLFFITFRWVWAKAIEAIRPLFFPSVQK